MENPIVKFEILRRISSTGAFGMLLYQSLMEEFVPVCGTLERTYSGADGAFWSKLKDGLWHCSKSRYFKGDYDTYEIHIPYHTRILFHKGNWPTDSEGCVLLGESYHDFDPKVGIQDPGVSRSADAFKEFMGLAGGVDSFFLKVTSA